MPNLTFVLPHWLYWLGLLAFPLLAMWMLREQAGGQSGQTGAVPVDRSTHFGISYFLWLTAGFIGMHRLYLRNKWGLLYIPLFIALLWANAEGRNTREGISRADNAAAKAEFLIERAEKKIAAGQPGWEEKLATQQAALAAAKKEQAAAQVVVDTWQFRVRALALAILAGLLIDFFLIPRLKRRCDELDAEAPVHASDFDCTTVTAEGGTIQPEANWFARSVGRLNGFAGLFVAYWSVIAVIVYYYEVIARYVFNSPTNWAHEGMFLMFGAQYLIAGGFCLRENAHVRVDVFYSRFSTRNKALVDVVTSAFFFIFVVSLMVTGWTFFMDSFEVREVSFTEWAIQYYPIKLTLALGALLLMLQGVSRLLSDIATLRQADDGY